MGGWGGGVCGAGNPTEEKKVYREGKLYEVTTDLQEGPDGKQEGTLQGPIGSRFSSSKEKKKVIRTFGLTNWSGLRAGSPKVGLGSATSSLSQHIYLARQAPVDFVMGFKRNGWQ